MSMETRVACERWDDEAAARYAGDAMPEEEREAFEDHYFDCAACLAAVQTLQEAGHQLAAPPARAVAAAAPLARFPSWVMAAVLAVVAVGAAVTLLQERGPVEPTPAASSAAPAPDGRLVALARAEPYPYVPFAGRGAGATPAFDQAMGRYLDRDYAGAAAALRALVERAGAGLEARFYLGVSELLSGQAPAAEKDLAVAAAAADDAVAGPARLYLARAHLARGDAAGAREVLRRLAASASGQAAAARALLAELDAIDRHE